MFSRNRTKNRKTAKIRPCGFESVQYFQKLRERERFFFFCSKKCSSACKNTEMGY